MDTKTVKIPDIKAKVLWHKDEDGSLIPYAVTGINISIDGEISIVLNDEKYINAQDVNKSFFESEDKALETEPMEQSIMRKSLNYGKIITSAMLDLMFPNMGTHMSTAERK